MSDPPRYFKVVSRFFLRDDAHHRSKKNDDREAVVPHILAIEDLPLKVYSVRMVQGHTNRNADPDTLGWRLLELGESKFLFHFTFWNAWKRIRDGGLRPGKDVS